MPKPASHIPVLPDEVLRLLAPQPGQVFVDGTLGGGGHTRLLAAAVGAGGRVIALDRDAQAIATAQQALADLPVTILHANFCNFPEALDQLGIDQVDGILVDLGLSSDQLADPTRGFSFHSDGPLDLRFDVGRGEPAYRLIERLSAEHLADIIYAYGEERFSRRIARNIVEARQQEPIRSAAQLAEVVKRSVPRSKDTARIHPATRTFQALRIAVNDELESLETLLRRAPERIRAGGKLAIISFHSLEDRRVKEAFRDSDRFDTMTRKPVRPTDEEVQRNPRSRSAKLRAATIR
jgi:16S rRNA (cytosine1402-N4)-methyltransferase